MSEASPTEFRIYCLCGQKMKVTRSMFGKPGKCVACRQKIRIPNDEERPPGNAALYLADHPEFLRVPGEVPPAPGVPEASAADPEGEVVLLEGDGDAESAAVPFQILAPLRALCNYEHRVTEQLEALRAGKPAERDKATLMSYRGLAHNARQQLEKQIGEELTAVGQELQETQAAIAAALRALEKGKTGYLDYSKRVLPLRKRREALAYHQHNLRGWLTTRDPHTAGGLEEVALADVPVQTSSPPFPLESGIEGLPIENAIRKLEAALRERQHADRRLNDVHRMSLDGRPAGELQPMRADTEAARERARARVAFYRSRLQQVIQDCEDDSGALNAFQAAKMRALEEEAITRDAFKEWEAAVFRAQVDVKRARNLATRALNANAVSDVPNPRGTFLERLARPDTFRGWGVDSWLAWAGSVLLLAVILVPLVSRVPGLKPSTFPGFTVAVGASGAALGLSAAILVRRPRALALNALWLVLTVAAAAYFQYETTSTSVAGATLRAGGPWWTSPWGMLLIAGWALAGLAALVAALRIPAIRWLGPANLAAGILIGALILADYAGTVQPEPALATVAPERNVDAGTYRVVIPLVNAGRRPFWVGGDPVRVPAPSTFVLERQVAPEAWAPAGPPAEVVVDGVTEVLDRDGGLEVSGGGAASFRYELAPGTYRVQLAPRWNGARPLRYTFTLDSFEVDLRSFFNRPESDRPDPDPDAARRPSTPAATVELRGVVTGQDNQPKFSVIVTAPDGETRQDQFELGDALHGDWTISEYSPAFNTITVTDGERLIVVERGTAEPLR